MIRFKDKTIGLQSLCPQLLLGLMIIEGVFSDHGEKVIITSVNDAKHSSGSSHYRGMGLDARSKYMTADKYQILEQCKEALGHNPDFYMALEYDGEDDEHFHLQYKPKRREWH
ncbi:hypothetical protein KAR91_46520 [Candidatus Pacearchaeota archaeon]|nr:hypothetical protein [Candidatus Pacearchaeota archaeon]